MPIEVQGVTPEEMGNELARLLQQSKENKYAFQVGLQDVDFNLDEEKLQANYLQVPFTSIDQAEAALQTGGIQPNWWVEFDRTRHQVEAFDHRTVGTSGFMDCVTHSLAITDQGLFEVGRYAAMQMENGGRFWRWFLHRQLATPEQVVEWQETDALSPQALLDQVFAVMKDNDT